MRIDRKYRAVKFGFLQEALGLSVRFPLVDYPFSVRGAVMLEFEQWNEMIPTRMFKKKEQTDKGERCNVFGLYQSLVASLWINNNMTGLVFFLGRDTEGVRIIQAVSETQKIVK